MNRISCLAALLLAIPFATRAADSGAPVPVPAQTRADIIQLINMTGGMRVGQLLGNAYANQIINNLKASHPDLPPKAFDIVAQETKDMLADRQSMEQLTQQLVPVFARYYSDDEVRHIIAFYKTPLGQKIIKMTPQITHDSLQVGEQWGRTVMGPELVQRIQARFKQEGIQLDGAAGKTPATTPPH
ncbi:MAG: DUF2059 domain-containing protein [Gammaproteobacteria bacterium]|nr:DUF2059 domain-containing protein [Gammaproteobacteria bacterium]